VRTQLVDGLLADLLQDVRFLHVYWLAHIIVLSTTAKLFRTYSCGLSIGHRSCSWSGLKVYINLPPEIFIYKNPSTVGSIERNTQKSRYQLMVTWVAHVSQNLTLPQSLAIFKLIRENMPVRGLGVDFRHIRLLYKKRFTSFVIPSRSRSDLLPMENLPEIVIGERAILIRIR
jgi:hypothetical protein